MVATYFMQVYSFDSIAATMGGGFFAGILIGYALKKLVKLAAVVIGLFFAGIAYLQYQQILNINWNNFEATSQNTLSTLLNATTKILGLGSGTDHTASLAFTNLGIPLTGGMSIGIAIGFMKG
ncbi:MAG TPA: FUN14 domain-containing protein [Nitrososphaeraceae archaeon]|nr:FUN14 domain-containing protein [Nitrososphaeraceae archaeon]